MRYVDFINRIIVDKVLESERIVLFGQNISAGSCLSGLTRNLKVNKNGLIINTPNCENTLCGIGFGLMINGVSSIFFMKQQDFLLLGIDHLVNTYNIIRQNKPLASFTIMTIVVDSGYEGPQSSLNNFGDFCSLARIPGFTITNKIDAEEIINSHLISPGFRIIGVSQRLFKKDIIEVQKIYSNKDYTLFQYTEGNDATIVCFNFSFPYGLELYNKLKEKGINSSLFSVNAVTPIKWGEIIENVKRTKNIIIIDDCKSETLSCYDLLSSIFDECKIENKMVIKRNYSNNWLCPNPDQITVDYNYIINKLLVSEKKIRKLQRLMNEN